MPSATRVVDRIQDMADYSGSPSDADALLFNVSTGKFEPGPVASGALNLFNVVDYGAVGDGTADDSGAIQDAIDAASVAGGTVYFPPGSYKLLTGLTYTAHMRTQFLGYGATLKPAAGVTALLVHQDDNGDAHPTTIDGFYIDGTAKASAAIGIEVRDSDYCFIRDVSVWNCGTGILLSTESHWTEACSLENVALRYSTIGLRFQKKAGAGTGSFMETRLSNVGAYCDMGIQVDDNCQLFHASWQGVTCWPKVGGTGASLAGDFQGAVIELAFDDVGGNATSTCLSIGATATGTDQWQCRLCILALNGATAMSVAGGVIVRYWRDGQEYLFRLGGWTEATKPTAAAAGAGTIIYVSDGAAGQKIQASDGANWVYLDSTGVTDHGALTGLADDDHSQYHTDARHAAINHTGITGCGANLTVKEEDGAPSVSGVTEIKVTNAKLTDNGGGSVSLDLSGGVESLAPGDYPYLGFGSNGSLSAEVDLLTLQLVNETKGWPPVVQPDSDLDALNLWWDKVGTPTTAPTVVDVAGEAGITETWELALKVVADAASEGLSQTWTFADEPRLKAGRVMSCLLAIWSVSGVSVTAKLTNSDASHTDASAVTAAAWTIVEIPAHTLAGTTVTLSVTAGAAGTFYVVPLGANIGARGVPLQPRPSRFVASQVVTVVNNVDPGGADYTDADFTAASSNLAWALQITGSYWGPVANGCIYIRRNGDTTADNSNYLTGSPPSTGVSVGTKIVPCDDGQVVEYKSGVAAGTAEGLSLHLAGFWEWA